MQPLVENAIKHGVLKRAGAGLIEISARIIAYRLELRIRDDGPGIKASAREGVGLSNTRERLRALYGEAADVVLNAPPAGGTEVILFMPFRAGSI
jgi:two-component system LytT family sensor kinase